MKTLLINFSYEALSFLTFRRLIRMLIKGKVEIVAAWSHSLDLGYTTIKYPAIVRMKYYVRRNRTGTRFNRRALFKRDMYQCQYCGKALTTKEITIDHVHPRKYGGKSSWENCVSCCQPCNAKKGDRTPEEVGMVLLNKPIMPGKNWLATEYILMEEKHAAWSDYFNDVEFIANHLKR